MDKISLIKKQTSYLNKCREAYYNGETSLITDKEYDNLLEELEALEQETNFRLQNSPTINVGYTVVETLPKSKHPTPLLSADKTKSIKDLLNFAHQNKCIASIKCDGLTTNIYVKAGKIVKGVTRGDGEIGQDISNNIPYIYNLPHNINTKEDLRITGESVIFEQDFERLKNLVKTSTGKQFSNTRNMASGSLTLLDNQKFAQRKVRFIAFNIEYGFPEIDSLSDCYTKLNQLGFSVVPYVSVPINVTEEEMTQITLQLKDLAEELGLPYDGIILRYDSRSYGKSLGRTEKFYKDMIAYKFENDWYETTLTNIEWNTSRNGLVIPTAIFEEVDVEGVKINRATLNNLKFINDLKLHKGDTIAISRRNEVIPYVERNYSNHDKVEEDLIPKTCPTCGKILSQMRDFLVCTNPSCSAQIIGKIEHFASKGAMNIEGLSEATIKVFVDKGWIKKPVDLYHLFNYKNEIIKMDGFGVKSYNNIIASIENSRKATLDKLIVSLGIPNVGKSLAKTIATYYNYDFNKFYTEGIQEKIDYNNLQDCGEKTSEILKSWFKQEKIKQELLKLSQELSFQVPEVIVTDLTSPFLNKKFCISGTFECGKRNELQERIEKMGGIFVSGVSKKTDMLIAGDKCGSKLDKAQQLGIQIVTEKELIQLLQEV